MIGLYERLMRGCQSKNQVNAVHIALENRMTPLEVASLWSNLTQDASWPERARRRWLRRASKLPVLGNSVRQSGSWTELQLQAHSNAWISRLQSLLGLAGRAQPVPFARRRLGHAISRFEGNGSRRDKTLLICFSGNAHRLMMPTALFLQHLDAEQVDVGWLKTDRSQGYRSGIRGLANDLLLSIDAIEALLDVRAYRRVAVMGTSGGGLPAVLTGLRLGADAVLAAGASSPTERRWHEHLNGQDAAAFFRGFAGQSARTPTVHLVHGADSPRDEEAARVIASLLDVQTIMPVPGATHACLFELVERREFRNLLESTVLTGGLEKASPRAVC